MKLRDIHRGQDYLIRAVRHLANRVAVIKEGKLHWVIGPEAAADGIMTRLWEQLDSIAARGRYPRRTKSPRRTQEEA